MAAGRAGLLDSIAFPSEAGRGYAKYDTNDAPWARPAKGKGGGAELPTSFGGGGGGKGKKGKGKGKGGKGARGKGGGKGRGGDRWHEEPDQLMRMLENPWHEFGVGAKYVVDFGALQAARAEAPAAPAPASAAPEAVDCTTAPDGGDDPMGGMDSDDREEFGTSAGAMLSAAEPTAAPAAIPQRQSVALSLPPPKGSDEAAKPAPADEPPRATAGLSLASLLPPPVEPVDEAKPAKKKKVKKRKRSEINKDAELEGGEGGADLEL